MIAIIVCDFLILKYLRVVIKRRRRVALIKPGRRTCHYIGKKYNINNPNGDCLKIDDWVWVHPSSTSHMREKYMGQIGLKYIKWTEDPGYEVVMEARNGYPYSAVMNEYCFNRLEIIKELRGTDSKD